MILFGGFNKRPYFCNAFERNEGRLAQLVQSVCLTSRGSGVRIPQRPRKRQCTAHKTRALSSAGSERLPYKQRVGGSNPSAPTKRKHQSRCSSICFIRLCPEKNPAESLSQMSEIHDTKTFPYVRKNDYFCNSKLGIWRINH